MKGIICECGCAKWWTKYVRGKHGLRLRRLQCRNCRKKIFTEEKVKSFETSYTAVTPLETASCSPDAIR